MAARRDRPGAGTCEIQKKIQKKYKFLGSIHTKVTYYTPNAVRRGEAPRPYSSKKKPDPGKKMGKPGKGTQYAGLT